MSDELARAEAYRINGDYAAAIQSYTSLLASHPEAADAWLGLARAYAGLERLVEAVDAITRCIALRPDGTIMDRAIEGFGPRPDWAEQVGSLARDANLYAEAGRYCLRLNRLVEARRWYSRVA